MKKIIGALFLILILCGLSACEQINGIIHPEPTATATEIPTATPLPDPQVMVTEVPDAAAAAEAFLAAWKQEDYVKMYEMLSQVSEDLIEYAPFAERYGQTAIALTLKTINYEITGSLMKPTSAQIAYHVDFDTVLVGTLSRDMNMEMVYEGNEWKVMWDSTMIMPELEENNKLVMDIDVPSRGTIYDVNGVPLAYQTKAYALGVVPANINPNYWSGLISEFSRLTGKTPQVIQDLMNRNDPTEYVVIGEVTAETFESRYSVLQDYDNVVAYPYDATRYYTEEGIGAHMIGYVTAIGEEESAEMQRAGYRIDERIGRLGIEKWGQEQLAGQRGASLYVVDSEGNTLDRLAKTDAMAADSIYTTFDEDFQYDLQRAIAGFDAAVVVLERDTGRVLGMASAPSFDANLLDYGNYNVYYGGDLLYNDHRPMYNRASQGQYPLGSVFKIIGMAAALENGIYNIDDTYECGYYFEELDGVQLHDWTLDHEVAASGMLTLSEALMRSCNPWFYKIGLELHRQVGPDALPDMARKFGLGSLTGIDEIEEEPGNVDTPPDEYSSVQLGIGQSTLLVTPLQVARFIAAIGNGGTLYRPQVVEQIVDAAGKTLYSFEPEVQGTLPVSEEHLEMIREAMLSVIRNPRGTAYNVFNQKRYNIYGKTGSASTAEGFDSDAWFAAYTDEQREDKPDIAIAVLAEYAGEGSDISAPICRRVLELYFEGNATTLYSWEAGIYITKTVTPTPTPSQTPRPTMNEYEIAATREAEIAAAEEEANRPVGEAVN